MNSIVKDIGGRTVMGVVFCGFVVALAAWMEGCAQAVVPPSVQGTTDVIMKNNAFGPHDVTINRGEKVRWINEETLPVPHTATSGDPDNPDHGMLWNSGMIQPGASFTHQFDEVGEFEYYCEFHYLDGVMRHAKVIVVEGQP
ncbi:MAG: cupredoxin domain-containing protein [Phycisphaerales bacterium]|nr:cupredoxin domain-containing protein [Phycisphaerales bacterium]